MNTKVRKGILWSVIAAATICVIKVLHFFLGGHSDFGAGRHGRGYDTGGMGQQGGFEPHHFMNGYHHEEGFPWIVLFIGLAVLLLIVRWFRKKAKSSSMNQFIDTPLVVSHIPVINQNASILDQWEKNLTDKKENE
jgi:H+/Cl- antiporter ClcA